MLFTVTAWDANCAVHIPPMFAVRPSTLISFKETHHAASAIATLHHHQRR